MKHLPKLSLLIIIIGVVIVVYQQVFKESTEPVSKSIGFLVFLIGLIIFFVSQFLRKVKKPTP